MSRIAFKRTLMKIIKTEGNVGKNVSIQHQNNLY